MNAALQMDSTRQGPSEEPTQHAIVERLSHELRTPLNSVIGFSRVLQGNRTGNQRPADLAMLEAIRANGERLLSLVEDLVALSVAPPVIELPASPLVNLEDIAEVAVEKWADVAACKGLGVVLEVQSAQPMRVDPTHLARLLDKLLGNAVKFTARGGVVVTVLRRGGEEGQVCIVIEDTGIGIPSHRLETIFEPFVQVDCSKSRPFEGAGLGLPIAKALARCIGCTLHVESEQGKGTRVEIRFPR